MYIASFSSLLLLAFVFSSCQFKKVYEVPNTALLPATAYLEKLEESEDYYLIDVRSPFEYKKKHLYGAENIPFTGAKFAQSIGELDKNKTVFIYCETAHRSPFAAKKLQEAGFKQIYDLKRGFRFWRKKGFSFKKRDE